MNPKVNDPTLATGGEQQWGPNHALGQCATKGILVKTIRVATCQFSVEADIAHNRRWALKQLKQAASQSADVVHFSECACSGYAGVDIPDTESLDWEQLVSATHDVQPAAREELVNLSVEWRYPGRREAESARQGERRLPNRRRPRFESPDSQDWNTGP